VARTWILSAEMRAWVEANQNKHPCACGCGGFVKVSAENRRKGIPKTKHGHHLNPSRPPEERFWSAVVKQAACWVYTGRRDGAGYGALFVGRRGKRLHSVKAHRYSWELHNGPIPPGLCVLHRCDNPPCVNPVHLFLGTIKDNVDDMVAKGRHRHGPGDASRFPALRGEQVPGAKLTAEVVREMRAGAAAGMTTRALAARHGVSQGAAWRVIRRLSWSHVT
jgi:hypothetical protein